MSNNQKSTFYSRWTVETTIILIVYVVMVVAIVLMWRIYTIRVDKLRRMIDIQHTELSATAAVPLVTQSPVPTTSNLKSISPVMLPP